MGLAQLHRLPTQCPDHEGVIRFGVDGHRHHGLGAVHRVSRAHSGSARCVGNTNPRGSPAAKDAAWL